MLLCQLLASVQALLALIKCLLALIEPCFPCFTVGIALLNFADLRTQLLLDVLVDVLARSFPSALLDALHARPVLAQRLILLAGALAVERRQTMSFELHVRGVLGGFADLRRERR